MINQLFEYKYLLYMLTLRDIKIKYKQSVMGFMWAIFMPMLIVAAGIIVKKAFSIVSGKPIELVDLMSMSVKAVPWAFFVGAIRFATASLTSNLNLVTKIYFPREILPISAIFSNLFDFFIASLTLAIILVFARIDVSIKVLWLPFLLFLLILLTIAIGIFFSCANAFFRDVKYIVEVILTFGIFFTPVFYEAEMFGKWATVILLNPVGSILEAINAVVVLHKDPDPMWLTYSILWTISGLMVAWKVFDKSEYALAENI